jgi:hypothetical protein
MFHYFFNMLKKMQKRVIVYKNNFKRYFINNLNLVIQGINNKEKSYNTFNRRFPGIYFIFYKRKIEKFIGYSFFDIGDAMSAASLMLIITKLIWRIFVGVNVVWYHNLLVLFFYFLISIKYQLVRPIREFLVKWIFSPLVNIHIYIPGTTIQILENQDPYNFAGEYKSPEEYYDTSTYYGNFIQQYFGTFFLTKLIQIRLAILCEPYLFYIFNFVLMSMLISNKYLILASVITLILNIARFLLYSSDITDTHFRLCITYLITEMNNNETIKPTHQNALLVLFWVVRSYSFESKSSDGRKLHIKAFYEGYSSADFAPPELLKDKTEEWFNSLSRRYYRTDLHHWKITQTSFCTGAFSDAMYLYNNPNYLQDQSISIHSLRPIPLLVLYYKNNIFKLICVSVFFNLYIYMYLYTNYYEYLNF